MPAEINLQLLVRVRAEFEGDLFVEICKVLGQVTILAWVFNLFLGGG